MLKLTLLSRVYPTTSSSTVKTLVSCTVLANLVHNGGRTLRFMPATSGGKVADNRLEKEGEKLVFIRNHTNRRTENSTNLSQFGSLTGIGIGNTASTTSFTSVTTISNRTHTSRMNTIHTTSSTTTGTICTRRGVPTLASPGRCCVRGISGTSQGGWEALISTQELSDHIFGPTLADGGSVNEAAGSPEISRKKGGRGDGELCIIDCSWFAMPMFNGRNELQEFCDGHIPGALLFDLDAASDAFSPYPHMLPSSAHFYQWLGESVGRWRAKLLRGDQKKDQYERNIDTVSVNELRTTMHFVLYDGAGVFTAPRVWWMFKAFGLQNVSVLDGGIRKWQSEHKPVARLTNEKEEKERSYTNITEDQVKHNIINEVIKIPLACSKAALENSCGNVSSLIRYHSTHKDIIELVRYYDERQEASSNTATSVPSTTSTNSNTTDAALLPIIVDLRSRGRFLGTAPEPRAGLPSGHIPHSVNVPFTSLLDSFPNGADSAFTQYKAKEELFDVFKEAGVVRGSFTKPEFHKEVLFSCGSGVTACIGFLALHICGCPLRYITVYDGSWTEWKMKQQNA